MRPDCYACVHRRSAVGSAHSRCEHPSNKRINDDPMANVFGILGSVGRGPGLAALPNTLNVTGHATGIRRGWFNWPVNYDPIWLLTCDGYTAKITEEAKQ